MGPLQAFLALESIVTREVLTLDVRVISIAWNHDALCDQDGLFPKSFLVLQEKS